MLATSELLAVEGKQVSDAVPAGQVSRLFIAKYALAYFGLFLALMPPLVATLAIRVAEIDPGNKGSSLSIILFLGAFLAMIANPLFGQLSDRTRSNFGRRRPWIIAGGIVGGLALGAIAYADSIWIICLAWCVAQMAMNAALAALVAVVPDKVPESQRAIISAVVGISVQVAVFLGIGLIQLVGTKGIAMFMVPTVVGVAAMMWLALTLDDKRPAAAPAPWRPSDLYGVLWVNPFKYRDFGWAWLSRFLVTLAFAFLQTYQVYYLTDALHTPADQVPERLLLIQGIVFACGSLAAIVMGILSDRMRRRKVFVFVAALVYCVGIALIILYPTFGFFLLGAAVAWLGFGTYSCVDQALVVDVLPNSETEAAKNMGVINIANVLPQSLAPAIAPAILAIGAAGTQNFTLLYVAAATVAFLGALAILPVRGVR